MPRLEAPEVRPAATSNRGRVSEGPWWICGRACIRTRRRICPCWAGMGYPGLRLVVGSRQVREPMTMVGLFG